MCKRIERSNERYAVATLRQNLIMIQRESSEEIYYTVIELYVIFETIHRTMQTEFRVERYHRSKKDS